MANLPSSKKRIRQNAKRRALNRWRKGTYRDLIKDYKELILHGTDDECKSKLSEIYKCLDKSAAKGAFHKKTVSRYKSRLADKLNHRKHHETAAA